ncbi:MAG: hypothetical protein ACOYMB_02460 [Patescibacteria group bacterium]
MARKLVIHVRKYRDRLHDYSLMISNNAGLTNHIRIGLDISLYNKDVHKKILDTLKDQMTTGRDTYSGFKIEFNQEVYIFGLLDCESSTQLIKYSMISAPISEKEINYFLQMAYELESTK